MKAIPRVLLVAVVAILVGDVAALTTIDRGEQPPSEWDPRIADLARFVEDKRQLRFDRPVRVRFLTEDEYRAEVTGDVDELTGEDKEEIANVEAEMRALGLLKKGVSLLDETNALTSGGTAAFYDPDAEEMVIRGTDIDIGMKVTLVHELTHALQDQHFDLSREFESDNQSVFFHALGEGDATRIEELYQEDLTEAEQEAYENETDEEEALEEIADVAPFLTQLFGAPYALGGPMTSLVVETDGVEKLNRLFENPPATDERLLDPFALLDDAAPVKVAVPKLRSGEKQTSSGDFGALTWYLVLASLVDEKTALAATDGWGGDSYVGYRKDGLGCIRARFVGDTPEDTQQMRTALDTWRGAFGTTATVTAQGDFVELDSCEPPQIAPLRDGFDMSLTLPVVRFVFVNEVLGEGGSRRLAQCFVREFFDRVTVARLNSADEADSERFQAIGTQVAQTCARRGEV